MDIEQLNYLVKLSKQKNFTATAEMLHISQSSLSKQITALENEVGAKLLVRTMKGCELTEAGEIFKDFAVKVLQMKKKALDKITLTTSTRQNTIVLGTMPILSEYCLSECICKFLKAHDRYNIKISENTNVFDLARKHKEGKYNLSIIGEGVLDKSDFYEIPLVYDEMVMVTSTKNTLANYDVIHLSKIERQKLLLLDDKTGLSFVIYENLKEVKSNPEIMTGYTNSGSILSMVRDNVGVTLLWRNLLNGVDLRGLKVIDLQKPIRKHVVLGVPKNRELTIAERLFKDYLIEFYKSCKINGTKVCAEELVNYKT